MSRSELSDSPETAREWKEMKGSCPRILAALTEEGRDGATSCLTGQCFAPGCMIDLPACVGGLDPVEVAEWYDIEMPER